MLTFLLIFMTQLTTAQAAVTTKTIEYHQGDTTLEGYVAYDDAIAAPKPGVLIVPDWMGPGPFAFQKAEQLAKEGYVGFVVDVYGKGVRPKDGAEAGKLAGLFKGDRPLLRARMRAALDTLTAMKQVNTKKVLVMGYCFGGTAALELARSGAPLAGVASFHGGLSSPSPQDARNIKAPVLAMHGADDPFVPAPEVQAFKDEMKSAGVDLKFIAYAGAVHSFTNPAAGTDNKKGAAYNASADKESWKAFEEFVGRVFGKK